MWNGTNNTSNSASALRNVVTIQQLSAFGMRNVSSVSSSLNASSSNAERKSTSSGVALPPPIVTQSPGSASFTGSSSASDWKLELMDLFFRIVVDRRVVYESETVRSTLNPIWVPIDFRESLVGGEFIGSSFEVLVFIVPSSAADGNHDSKTNSNNNSEAVRTSLDAPSTASSASGSATETTASAESSSSCCCAAAAELMFHFRINCRELELLPIALEEVVTLPANTCVFEFAGRVYLRKEIVQYLFDTGVIAFKYAKRRSSTVSLREYDIMTGMRNVERIVALREANKSMTHANDRLKDQVATRMEELKVTIQQKQKCAELEAHVRRLRQDVQLRQQTLARVQAVMQEEREIIEGDVHIPNALASTTQMFKRYKEVKQGTYERRCEVLRAAHKIRARQANLVKQLGNVYPIEYIGAGEYSIRGIKVTNSDLLNSRDEETMSTALGYVAHLMFMLSKYLHVNLRYRIVPFSSRSYLKDEINDPNGEFPLYRKGADRDRYERALGFLRRDVEQLLASRELPQSPNAPLLAHLKTLADTEIAWLANDREITNSSSSSSSHNAKKRTSVS